MKEKLIKQGHLTHGSSMSRIGFTCYDVSYSQHTVEIIHKFEDDGEGLYKPAVVTRDVYFNPSYLHIEPYEAKEE